MTDASSPPVVRDLPDDLPPVKPPSVGFIFQLFVVPALIVAAVVAVWVLFGRIASSEQDWQSLIADLNSPNQHIRHRAMNGLAQVLDNDRRLGPAGQQLARNTQIAQGLSDTLTKKLAGGTSSSESLSDLVFLTRAFGQLDLPETALSPLLPALSSACDTEIRKGAITSVSLIAGRAWEQQSPFTSPELAVSVIQMSQDTDLHLRRAAAFCLGLIRAPAVTERLIVLLEDPDWMTAVNAAVALARQGSTAGYTVLKEIMAGKVVVDPEVPAEASASEVIIFRNGFKAVSGLAGQFSAEQKSELTALIGQLAQQHREIRVRTDAQAALIALKAAP